MTNIHYMIDDHILTEGWCNLHAASNSDYNMFVFFGHQWISMFPIYSSDQKPLGALVGIGDYDHDLYTGYAKEQGLL